MICLLDGNTDFFDTVAGVLRGDRLELNKFVIISNQYGNQT